jgi:hypothetical protein
MTASLIWLHEDALRATHPVFAAAGAGAEVVHIWDDTYLREADYSLKRLVFLYETLCELGIPIVHGDSVAILQEYEASHIFIPASLNPFIEGVARRVKGKQITFVADEAFVTVSQSREFRRFFQYWNKAEKTAFLRDGGMRGEDGSEK